MARFQAKHSVVYGKKIVLSLVLFLLLFLLFLQGVGQLSDTAKKRQKEQLEHALTRAVTYSYAVNGYYPENLPRLVEEYNIHYNEELFYVDYRVLGGNLFPEITILMNKEVP